MRQENNHDRRYLCMNEHRAASMSKKPLKCMFDTNVFNRILDGELSLAALGQDVIAHATHVQRDELQKTRDEARRQGLLRVFREAVTDSVKTKTFVLDVSRLDEGKVTTERMVPTSSAVYGVSPYGESKYGGEDSGLYSTLRGELDRLEEKENNVHDALIADTAIKGGYVLITDDGNLAKVTKQHGGVCLSVKDLSQQVSEQNSLSDKE